MTYKRTYGEGDHCWNAPPCDGRIRFPKVECTCFLGHPPCGACEYAELECAACGMTQTEWDKPKLPLGAISHFLWQESKLYYVLHTRIRELEEAQNRYTIAGREPPPEWSQEVVMHRKFIDKINARRKEPGTGINDD